MFNLERAALRVAMPIAGRGSRRRSEDRKGRRVETRPAGKSRKHE
jgi:hypothetical protein